MVGAARLERLFSVGERDTFGAQRHAPLMDIVVP